MMLGMTHMILEKIGPATKKTHTNIKQQTYIFDMGKYVVLGDVMIDKYYDCKTDRLAPEAPICVHFVNNIDFHSGGAFNVAKNISDSTNKDVVLLCMLGDDENGNIVKDMARSYNIEIKPVISKHRPTIEKNRICTDGIIQCRFDREIKGIEKEEEDLLIKELGNICSEGDIIVVSDYCKNVVSPRVAKKVMQMSAAMGTKVIVDSKNNDISLFKGCHVIKPNKMEANVLCGKYKETEFKEMAKNIREVMDVDHVVLTADKNGCYVDSKFEGSFNIKTETVAHPHVTGAGDVVLSVIAVGIGSGHSIEFTSRLAMKCARRAIMRHGTSYVNKSDIEGATKELKFGSEKTKDTQAYAEIEELKKQGKKIVFTCGCFDILHAGHLKNLEYCKTLGDIVVVGLNTDGSIKRLKGENRPKVRYSYRKRTLEALRSVNYVIGFDEDTPQHMIERIQPNIICKGDDYSEEGVVGHELVEKVVLFPRIGGLSTTDSILNQ
jgi:D-beta-D-heptose 7-phosphate kinase / D-beta-D-heptose 1-phosphate adenosyltransferase